MTSPGLDLGQVVFRGPKSNDARTIWSWTELVGWNEAFEDISLFVDTFPEGWIMAELNGQLIGCSFYCFYGTTSAFGGFTIVEESLRGKGIGKLLLARRKKICVGRTFGVNAVANRVQPNIRLGYQHTTWQLGHYEGEISNKLKQKKANFEICKFSKKDLGKVLEFDHTIHPFARDAFLEKWFDRPNIVSSIIAVKDNRVIGCGILSSVPRGYRINSFYAVNQDVALAILENLTRSLQSGSVVAMFVPFPNDDAMGIVKAEGMKLALEPMSRQYTTEDVELPLNKVYSLSTLDITFL